jgi:hypothetical protein
LITIAGLRHSVTQGSLPHYSQNAAAALAPFAAAVDACSSGIQDLAGYFPTLNNVVLRVRHHTSCPRGKQTRLFGASSNAVVNLWYKAGNPKARTARLRTQQTQPPLATGWTKVMPVSPSNEKGDIVLEWALPLPTQCPVWFSWCRISDPRGARIAAWYAIRLKQYALERFPLVPHLAAGLFPHFGDAGDVLPEISLFIVKLVKLALGIQ